MSGPLLLAPRPSLLDPDIKKLKGEIEAAIPGVKCLEWRDYGRALDVELGDRSCVAYQPETPWHPEIRRSVNDVKRALALH